MGRGYRIDTPDTLERIIGMYFDDCSKKADEGVAKFPSYEGMMNYIQRNTEHCFGDVETFILAKIHSNEDQEEAAEYQLIMTMAERDRADWLQNVMVTNPKLATGCMYALKQPHNGGFIDRSVSEKDTKIMIDATGLGIEKPGKKGKKK